MRPALDRFVGAIPRRRTSGRVPAWQRSRSASITGSRDPSTGGACKRLHLFLRWMVRREPPDFGDWRGCRRPQLLIPLDTHIENMAHAIRPHAAPDPQLDDGGRHHRHAPPLDPADPVKYDFALCHKRMSGQCLDRRDARVCPACQPPAGLPPLVAR